MNAATITGHHPLNRRSFLDHTGTGLSSIALAMMLAEQGLLKGDESRPGTVGGRKPIRPEIDPAHPFASRQPHFPAAAKRVVVIFCSGACSHLDTFDYKPELIARHGQPLPGADKLITFQGEQG
ncbi:MAG TPA: DUF1501 domain-containing protein, partial [Planctomycetaceae bacterium]|nr:DUF1501 domain-containing protein [Planctomycetaceae bacterium]